MKLKTKSSKKKFAIVLLVIIAVAALSTTAYALYRANSPQTSTDDTADFQDVNPVDTQSQEKQQSYEDQKKEDIADETPEETPDTLSVTFTSVSQMDAIVRVRAEISALIEGTCTLTLTKGSESVTKTAATQPLAGISTCQGFDVPTSDLSAGTWNVTLEVTKGEQSGRATTTVDVS